MKKENKAKPIKNSPAALYQARKSFQKDWVRYHCGEIVEIIGVHANVYEPSLIIFIGRSGIKDQMEAEEFAELFIQDRLVPQEIDDKRPRWKSL